MNATIGYGLVLSGLLCAAFGAVVGLYTGMTRRESALPWVQRAVFGFSASMILANLVMVGALLQHDYSVKYVAQVGSNATPTVFTIVSLWSSLEGSILFWGAIMGGYLFAFAWIHRHEHGRYMQLSLGMMCAVATFFAFLIAGPANPWGPQPNPIPTDGPGPNALLQNHVLMIIHPPMLYLGFVGMTVPFGIATGALLRGELGDAWLVPLRKWTLVPWTFLSVGIILGSWWAYAVLGWGGYWAWDPVENASFHPWLAATAFIHSTMVLERKKSLKLWTLSLVLGTFWLTIVGTFMTRSGVFNSVHSFTQSDIGPTFLVFIAILMLVSIVLLALRGPLLVAESQLQSIFSREGSILLNNLVFSALTFTVFLGTTYPLITESLANKRISVGEPYFNIMALPIALLMLFLMGVGPMLPWGEANPSTTVRQLAAPVGGAALAIAAWWVALGVPKNAEYGPGLAWAVVAFGLAGFVAVITLRELLLPATRLMTENQESLFRAFVRSASRAPRRFGGYVVHLGIVIIIVAIAASSSFKVHSSGTLKAGQLLDVGEYKVRFDGLSNGTDPHRTWTSANVTIIHPDGKEVSFAGKSAPRMNFYERQTDPVGSPLVHELIWRDVYVSLLAFDGKEQSASFNAWVFPLVGWIWYAIPILVAGSLISLWPRRRQLLSGTAPAPAEASRA
jgi:cytochrome c-type biogenesis protein CcmF